MPIKFANMHAVTKMFHLELVDALCSIRLALVCHELIKVMLMSSSAQKESKCSKYDCFFLIGKKK